MNNKINGLEVQSITLIQLVKKNETYANNFEIFAAHSGSDCRQRTVRHGITKTKEIQNVHIPKFIFYNIMDCPSFISIICNILICDVCEVNMQDDYVDLCPRS
jgi:hypothetical protein